MAETNGPLVWDQAGEKLYETGTDRGAIYPYKGSAYQAGVAWTGLRQVSESPDGAEETALYADNIKYASMLSAENFKFTIGAYTYPDEFAALDGSAPLQEGMAGVTMGQQNRGMFGFSYRTLIGNDTEGNEFGYKLHIVYGAKVSPSSRENNTINDSPAAVEMSWDATTTPQAVPGGKSTAHIVIDSTKVTSAQLKAVEDMLYGTESQAAKLPMPSDLISIFSGTTTPAAG